MSLSHSKTAWNKEEEKVLKLKCQMRAKGAKVEWRDREGGYKARFK